MEKTKKATITIINAAGDKQVHEGKMTFTYGKTRTSQWCAANQKQLDELIKANPDTISATINDDEFVVKNGRSSFVFDF